MDKESLGDMTSRFYHLLTELNNFGVVTTTAEVVKKFADALPPQWNSFLEILKYNGVLATTNINDFVQLLENKDQEETLKAKRVPVPKNPEMYYGTPSASSAKSIVPCNPEMYYGTSSSSSARPGSHAPLQTAFVTSTDMYGNQIQVPVKPAPTTDMYGNPLQPPPPSQACYGGTSSAAGQQSKPDTVRLNTSSFSKVSVEVAKEHMELLNTLVSAYCGLVEGQIGNINLTQEDYQQIDKEEMEMMDIKWAFASAVRRAKDFMERTGRTSLESKKDTKYGFDKQAVKCFNCGERGHFKRECTRPSQHGNQNPFRGQGNRANQNQVRNNERTLVPVNNQSQAGPSNANQALVVQVDEGCDWSIQLSGDAPDGTTCFAEIVKDLVHTSGGESSANVGESSEDEDSSGYSRSSDEESSRSGDDHVGETSSASVDADIDELLEEAAAGTQRRSILVDQAAYSSSFLHSAFMANVDSSSSQANMSELQGKHDALQASLFDLQDKHVSLNAKWCELQSKHEALQEKYDVTFIHNQKLTVDLSKCTEANMFYENHEKEFKSVIEKLKKDKTELTKMVSRKQTDINLYISRLEIMQKEMACVKTESEAI
ncbi:putative transcription factor interactor and regulator CCHC(Zn) family [Helianthus annuus]|nr:putative transcription factor interactor and regulator CCHC(Zn) family [Helianthus annuus]